MIDCQGAVALFAALADTFTQQEQPLNALDAAIGDGDHGTTILRGMLAAKSAAAASAGASPGAIFADAGAAFQKAAGGAGGTVFAQVFKAIGHAGGDGTKITPQELAQGFDEAATQVQKLGRARLGGKTMLDALDPAAKMLAATGDLGAALGAARAGADATREMTATLGRARFVSDGGKGHLDPGARSVVLILEEIARQSSGAGEATTSEVAR